MKKNNSDKLLLTEDTLAPLQDARQVLPLKPASSERCSGKVGWLSTHDRLLRSSTCYTKASCDWTDETWRRVTPGYRAIWGVDFAELQDVLLTGKIP